MPEYTSDYADSIETVAEVMMNCWGECFDDALQQVKEYYNGGAVYNMRTAEWEWPNA